MKRSIYLMAFAALLVFVWSPGSFAADKIGFINLQEIMQESIAGKKAADDFKKYFEKESQKIKTMETQLKKMKDELDKQGSVLTPASRSEKEAAYQKQMRDYQLLVNDTNEELKRRDQEMFQKLMPGISKIIRAIAEKEKYTLVIDPATMPILYYDKEGDFSKRVLDEFNKVK